VRKQHDLRKFLIKIKTTEIELLDIEIGIIDNVAVIVD